jgi:enoyl-CoA hydratase/carnithine racemase
MPETDMLNRHGRTFGQDLQDTSPTLGADFEPEHFKWEVDGKLATITLNRPDKKNPLTFESYAELRDTFRALTYAEDVKAVVITGAGGNFCTGGDVNEIIGPLLDLDMAGLLNFTRMTGDLVKAIRYCPQPVIAAIDGICAGAGGAIAMACDIRFGTPDCKTLYLFNRVGLAGCDMGACAILPRIIGQGRAAELLYTGRAMTADEGERWGFFNRLIASDQLLEEAQTFARRLADGPTFGNAMTKKMFDMEWTMGLEQYIEAEAQAQAICMQTQDYHRAYHAFIAKEKPVFEGN